MSAANTADSIQECSAALPETPQPETKSVDVQSPWSPALLALFESVITPHEKSPSTPATDESVKGNRRMMGAFSDSDANKSWHGTVNGGRALNVCEKPMPTQPQNMFSEAQAQDQQQQQQQHYQEQADSNEGIAKTGGSYTGRISNVRLIRFILNHVVCQLTDDKNVYENYMYEKDKGTITYFHKYADDIVQDHKGYPVTIASWNQIHNKWMPLSKITVPGPHSISCYKKQWPLENLQLVIKARESLLKALLREPYELGLCDCQFWTCPQQKGQKRQKSITTYMKPKKPRVRNANSKCY